MISAFGIDHGEDISKVRGRLPAVFGRGARGPGGKRLTRAQKRTMGTPGAPTRTQQLGAKANQIGEADISIKGLGRSSGRGLKRTGGFLERHPGVAGTGILAGGGGAGYYAYKRGQRKAAYQ